MMALLQLSAIVITPIPAPFSLFLHCDGEELLILGAGKIWFAFISFLIFHDVLGNSFDW